DTENVFCGNCGSNMDEATNSTPAVQPIPQPQYPPQQSTQRMYSTQYVAKPQTNSPTALGIIGFILNIITFVGLSWGSWVVFLYVIIIFFVVAIVGIIMSAIAIKNNRTLSVVGLILGILGTLPILGALFIMIIFYAIL
ncbi:MAG: hypothetical protein ACTSQ0_06650, partial [Candidatus Heimdallarchaeota archaeon]